MVSNKLVTHLHYRKLLSVITGEMKHLGIHDDYKGYSWSMLLYFIYIPLFRYRMTCIQQESSASLQFTTVLHAGSSWGSLSYPEQLKHCIEMAKEVNKVLASIIFEEAADRHLNLNYSWSSLQQPPWGQKKVAIVERLKQQWMYGLSTKKDGCCREVAVIRGSTVIFMYTLRPGAPVKTNRVLKWWRHKHKKFVKLWDLSRYSERTTFKTPTRQKLAIRDKFSLRH